MKAILFVIKVAAALAVIKAITYMAQIALVAWALN